MDFLRDGEIYRDATNAIKYGALSVDSGGVDVSWRAAGNMFTMSWIEHDGPPVSPPERTGFGSTVITSLAKLTIGGQAQLEHAPSGTTWGLTCPAENALEPDEREQRDRTDNAAGKAKMRTSA
jgi:two-component sensor histidine kinase